MLQGKDFLSMESITKDDVMEILTTAAQFEAEGYPNDLLCGKVIGSCFFEPSTRTRLSFETAALRLGAGVVGFSGTEGLSMKKGESFEDTIRIIAGYTDAIVLRHPEAGSSVTASHLAEVAVVNAGDGTNEHPTQALTDLYAMYKTQKNLDDLHVALVGDLKYGRTVHSLAKGLCLFPGVVQYWVAPEELRMPDGVKAAVVERGAHVEELRDMKEFLRDMDIVVMTRVQEERFGDRQQYEQLKDTFVLSPELLAHVKPNLRILHPLPRRFEIPPAIDASPHAFYFPQAWGGVAVRAALLAAILGK